jgi:FAD:protein FMN transferase
VVRAGSPADDATAAYAQGADAATWLGSRPGRSGLVIWADGSVATVRDGASLLPSVV